MRDLKLPPVFDPYPLGGEDPFAWARARAGDLGAGAFVHAVLDHELRCAVVLEPDPAGPSPFGVLLAGSLALGDALASLGPPNLVLHHGWPGSIGIGGAGLGGLRLAAGPAGTGRPDWLVLGASVVLAFSGVLAEDPGLEPDATSLAEEGFEIGPEELVESYARHLLNRISLFQEEGIAGLRGTWLSRWRDRGRPVSLASAGGPVAGEALDIDGQGALVLADGRRVPLSDMIMGEAQ